MKRIARGTRIESMFEGVPGSWAELKAVALGQPNPRVMGAPIDPAWLFECAWHLQLDISADGSDHLMLPFVIALARAPLPAHWHPLTPATLTDEEILRNPKWFEPPPRDDQIYAARKNSSKNSSSTNLAGMDAPASAYFRKRSTLSSKPPTYNVRLAISFDC